MTDTFDKILDASFSRERLGLHWVEFREKEDETGEWYSCWLLVQETTDRMLVSIDGPTSKQICYTVAVEGYPGVRKYISLDGAKRNAIAIALQIIGDEGIASAQRRHARQSIKRTAK